MVLVSSVVLSRSVLMVSATGQHPDLILCYENLPVREQSFVIVGSDESQSRILFCNPDNIDGEDAKGSSIFRTRKNLTMKLSYDECQTWAVSKVIESGLSGYSAIAVCPDKNDFVFVRAW